MRFMMIVIPKGYGSAAPEAMPNTETVAKMQEYTQANQQLKEHLQTFLVAYNFAKSSKLSEVSLPISSSAKPGRNSPSDLLLTFSGTLWD